MAAARTRHSDSGVPPHAAKSRDSHGELRDSAELTTLALATNVAWDAADRLCMFGVFVGFIVPAFPWTAPIVYVCAGFRGLAPGEHRFGIEVDGKANLRCEPQGCSYGVGGVALAVIKVSNWTFNGYGAETFCITVDGKRVKEVGSIFVDPPPGKQR